MPAVLRHFTGVAVDSAGLKIIPLPPAQLQPSTLSDGTSTKLSISSFPLFTANLCGPSFSEQERKICHAPHLLCVPAEDLHFFSYRLTASDGETKHWRCCSRSPGLTRLAQGQGTAASQQDRWKGSLCESHLINLISGWLDMPT